MARSGSASRASRGVSSWSAAVRMPTFMNCGANGRMLMRLRLDGRPDAALPCAGEHRIDETVRAVAVLERRERRRPGAARFPAGGDDTVNVLHDVGEGVRPTFLMSARQAGVRPDLGLDERRILLQHRVGLM